MKKVIGIILIIIQIIVIVGAVLAGKNPFSGGIFFLLGYFLCGIIGVILIVIDHINKKRK